MDPSSTTANNQLLDSSSWNQKLRCVLYVLKRWLLVWAHAVRQSGNSTIDRKYEGEKAEVATLWMSLFERSSKRCYFELVQTDQVLQTLRRSIKWTNWSSNKNLERRNVGGGGGIVGFITEQTGKINWWSTRTINSNWTASMRSKET